MLVRDGNGRSAALLAVAASFALAGCQPSVDVSRVTVDRHLPPAREVEIQLVTDEDGRPIVPNAITGKQVFEANCAVCHGMNGDGKGPMAYTLVAPDKDAFTALLGLFGIVLHRPSLTDRPFPLANRDIENVITPAILFETVTEGRPHTAMPAFGPEASFGANKAQTLSNAQRWDANVYEMMFRTSPQELSAAKGLYDAQCAACHGISGDGKGPRGGEMAGQLWSWSRGEGPGIFTDINYIIQRNPSELTSVIQDGHGLMPAYRDKLTSDQINGLVDYIYTFFYKHPPIK